MHIPVVPLLMCSGDTESYTLPGGGIQRSASDVSVQVVGSCRHDTFQALGVLMPDQRHLRYLCVPASRQKMMKSQTQCTSCKDWVYMGPEPPDNHQNCYLYTPS
jgi:hypothetical protein